jgi:predicted nuclease with TOPRIM domain
VERLREENERLKPENSSLRQEVVELRQQLSELTQRQGVELPDLEGLREHYLASLKLGSSAPQYKAALKALNYLINQLAH